MKNYKGTNLRDTIKIGELFTVHYFEYSKNYRYYGERHDFWEFVYADRGEIIITADDREFLLGEGQIFFHKPNQWHNLRANGETAPNVCVVSFSSNSPKMSFFRDKLLDVGREQKVLISKIISEFYNSFSTPLGDSGTTSLERRKNILTGSEQLLKMYISELLILLIRNNDSVQQSVSKGNLISANIRHTIDYMNSNITRTITLEELCIHSGMSRSSLSSIFSSTFGMGPIDYFINLKVVYAKKYIREDNFNITQIAEMLGYSTIHYFSRQFKKVTGMSPSEYSNSVKAYDGKGDFFNP